MAKILDLAGESAAFGTRLLAEAGHDVVRVEDTSRAWTPRDLEDHAYNAFIHAGKRGVALDLSASTERQLLFDLAATCDAIVVGEDIIGKGRTISLTDLTHRNAGAILTQVVDDDVELLAAARSGLLSLTGHPGKPPRLPGGHVIFAATGLYVAVATALALYQRGTTGYGQVVTVSVRQALQSLVEQAMTEYTIAGKGTERHGSRGAITAISGGLACKDGYWMLAVAHNTEGWGRMMSWMCDPELASDPSLADEAKRHEKSDYIIERIEAWSRSFTRTQLVQEAQARHIPASPVCTPLDLVADEQLIARGFLQRVNHRELGQIMFPRGAVATALKTEVKPYEPPQPVALDRTVEGASL